MISYLLDCLSTIIDLSFDASHLGSEYTEGETIRRLKGLGYLG